MFAQALKAFINLDYLYFDFHSGLYLRNIHYKSTKNPIKSKKMYQDKLRIVCHPNGFTFRHHPYL